MSDSTRIQAGTGVTPPCMDGGPASLVGTMIRVRPYYHVPAGRSQTRPERSPWTFRAIVDSVTDQGTATITYWPDDRGPWGDTQIIRIGEMHDAKDCNCAACVYGGPGFHTHNGA